MDEILLAYEDGAIDVLALHEALERLTAFAPDMARAVELRFFGGLAVETVASQLGIDLRSFERRWRAARAWLRAELG